MLARLPPWRGSIVSRRNGQCCPSSQPHILASTLKPLADRQRLKRSTKEHSAAIKAKRTTRHSVSSFRGLAQKIRTSSIARTVAPMTSTDRFRARPAAGNSYNNRRSVSFALGKVNTEPIVCSPSETLVWERRTHCGRHAATCFLVIVIFTPRAAKWLIQSSQ